MTANDFRVLSLFSGGGGMDIGFEGGFHCLTRSLDLRMHPDWVYRLYGRTVLLIPTGFRTVFANDIRPAARRLWGQYMGRDDVYHLGSIVDMVKRAKAGDAVFPADIDIVTGGFPCQDFSLAGKRNGFHSQRSHTGARLQPGEPSVESRGQLYMWMRDVITLTEPRVFVAENVKGLVNLDDVKAVIERDFAQAGGGYLVVPARILRAVEYGVPQTRERVIFYGFRKSALLPPAQEALSQEVIPAEYDPYPVPTHGEAQERLSYVTCSEALSDLPEPSEATDVSQRAYSHAKYMGRNCQGQIEIRMDAPGPTIRSEHHGNIEFRRLSEAHGGVHTDELAAGLLERRLTVRECARLQTFPDAYSCVIPRTKDDPGVSPTDGYRIIGNAVPPVLAYHIAMRLRELWPLYFG